MELDGACAVHPSGQSQRKINFCVASGHAVSLFFFLNFLRISPESLFLYSLRLRYGADFYSFRQCTGSQQIEKENDALF